MTGYGGESDTKPALRAAQISQLYQQGYPSLLGALLGAIILTVALWEVVSHLRLVLWLGIYVLLQIPRLWLVASFKKLAPKDHDALPWARGFVLGNCMGGFMWGIAGVFLFPATSSEHQFLLSVFVTGIACGAATSYAPLRAAYAPTIFLEMIPLSGRFVYEGSATDLYIGSVIFLFTFILLLAARNIEVTNERSLRLMFEKDDLVDSLIAKTRELESLSSSLKTEIDERKKAEKRVIQSLDEKDVLLREIHHRVKNNLAIVSSLLGFQSRHARDQYHREMFIESQDRIRTMSLAHEKLYQSENLSAINSKDYLTSLARDLKSALTHVGSDVQLQLEIAEVSLDLEIGVTLGFIVTELLSNCIKHAFPDGGSGKISLILTENSNSALELTVTDNGIGLPEDIQFQNPNTLGLDLVRIFSRQIRGQLEVRRNHGTEIVLRFSRRP